jgi:hypothetical protein
MEIRCQFVFSGKNDELTPDFCPFHLFHFSPLPSMAVIPPKQSQF